MLSNDPEVTEREIELARQWGNSEEAPMLAMSVAQLLAEYRCELVNAELATLRADLVSPLDRPASPSADTEPPTPIVWRCGVCGQNASAAVACPCPRTWTCPLCMGDDIMAEHGPDVCASAAPRPLASSDPAAPPCPDLKPCSQWRHGPGETFVLKAGVFDCIACPDGRWSILVRPLGSRFPEVVVRANKDEDFPQSLVQAQLACEGVFRCLLAEACGWIDGCP